MKRKKKCPRGNSKKKNYNKKLNISLFGTNSNGLKGKIDSLNNSLKQFGMPSFVTIQETKLRSNNFKIPGYQVYQKNRIGLGGGILTAIDEILDQF